MERIRVQDLLSRALGLLTGFSPELARLMSSLHEIQSIFAVSSRIDFEGNLAWAFGGKRVRCDHNRGLRSEQASLEVFELILKSPTRKSTVRRRLPPNRRVQILAKRKLKPTSPRP